MLSSKQAFTLIELLVVVLIIGILAAVAVPQYRVAVAKSRIGALLPTMGSLAQAQEVYYLVNGRYGTAKDLDVDMPAACEGVTAMNFRCGTYLMLNINSNGTVNLNYCPGKNQTEQTCLDNRDVHITFRPHHYSIAESQRSRRLCVVYHNSSLGKAVCASLGLN